MIEALERLREWARVERMPAHTFGIDGFGKVCKPPIPFEKGEEICKYCDEIQAEIDARYMELPVDADGVPIHVGDNLVHIHNEHANGEVFGIVDSDTFYFSSFPLRGNVAAHMYRHFKPRTVEDVLMDVLRDSTHPDMGNSDIVEKYAAELQMRGDAE